MKNNFSNIMIFVILFSVSSCKMPKLATYEKNADLSAIEATPNGVNKKNFNDGSIYEGEFVNGLPSGNGKLTTPDGKIITGTFYLGNISYGKITYNNGNAYTGNFLNNIPNGKGFLEKADGSYYKGEFVNGKINGEGVVYSSKEKSFLYADFDADLNSKGKGVLIDANKNAQPVYYEKGSSENGYEDFIEKSAKEEVVEIDSKLIHNMNSKIQDYESEVQEIDEKINVITPFIGKSRNTQSVEICESLEREFLSYNLHHWDKINIDFDNVIDDEGHRSDQGCVLNEDWESIQIGNKELRYKPKQETFNQWGIRTEKNKNKIKELTDFLQKKYRPLIELCYAGKLSDSYLTNLSHERVQFTNAKSLLEEQMIDFKNKEKERIAQRKAELIERDKQNADAILSKHEQFMQHCSVLCECGCIPKTNCKVCAR